MDAATRERIDKALQSAKIVLFMKGNKAAPQCAFSAQAVSILTREQIEFCDVDVQLDRALRQGLKELSSWPTFPQLYVGGEFLGGVEIVNALNQSGEFGRVLGVAC
jgi:monothiol glutaredoxin